jgi:hypothetical protein
MRAMAVLVNGMMAMIGRKAGEGGRLVEEEGGRPLMNGFVGAGWADEHFKPAGGAATVGDHAKSRHVTDQPATHSPQCHRGATLALLPHCPAREIQPSCSDR